MHVISIIHQLLFNKILKRQSSCIVSCTVVQLVRCGLLPWPSLYITRNPKASPSNAVLAKSGAIRLS